jgi:hypothetical protein
MRCMGMREIRLIDIRLFPYYNGKDLGEKGLHSNFSLSETSAGF